MCTSVSLTDSPIPNDSLSQVLLSLLFGFSASAGSVLFSHWVSLAITILSQSITVGFMCHDARSKGKPPLALTLGLTLAPSLTLTLPLPIRHPVA